MKKIPVAGGHHALVDDQDYEEVSKYRWRLSTTGYATRTIWYGRQQTPKHRHITMHRELLGSAAIGKEIDHRNGVKLDNRRENLRPCTHRENARNRGKTRANTTGFKGVVKHAGKQSKGFIAQIRVDNKNRYLGYFPTPELAAAAYNKAAIQHFGEFVQINALPQ